MGVLSDQKYNNSELPKLFGAKDVASWPGKSREPLFDLCATQGFPFIKVITQRIRFVVDDVKYWLNACCRKDESNDKSRALTNITEVE